MGDPSRRSSSEMPPPVHAKMEYPSRRTSSEIPPPEKKQVFESMPLPLPTNLLKKNKKRQSPVGTRIVGGTEVTSPSVYPFFVSWTGNCGGSLIHPDIVLTAAHCDAVPTNYVTVNAFELDNSTTIGAETRSIAERVPHPEFNSNTVANDFMLLKLSNPVKARPIDINSDSSVPVVGQELRVIGLGKLSAVGAERGQKLREVTVQAVGDDVCDQLYFGAIVKDVMFCAGVPEGGKDACQGDSGGPIFSIDESTGKVDKQVGVVSWGYGCGEPDSPGVYSEVSSVKSWIYSQVCALSDVPPLDCPAATMAPTPTPPGPDEAGVYIRVTTDPYPQETSWELTDSNGEVVERVAPGGYNLPTHLYETVLNLKLGETYTFTIFDTYSDGICCDGGYEIVTAEDGVVVVSGSLFGAQETTTLVIPDGDEATPAPIVEGNVPIELSVMTDNFPSETSWTLYNNLGSIVARAPEGSYTMHNHLHTTSLKLEQDREYLLNVTDYGGDGMCCQHGQGYYEMKTAVSGEVLAKGGEFKFFETVAFVVPPNDDAATPPPAPSPGTCSDDLDALIEIDDAMGEKSCSWLATNRRRYGYLCQFVDVASVCPVTCNWCSVFS